MGTVYGFPNALNDFGGNVNDPRYLAAAAAIGARIDPKTGAGYDLIDGHKLTEREADERARDAGVAVESKRDSGGLAGLYNRNKSVINPALEVGATLLGGPAAGAAVGAGLNYSQTHDLGQAALAGVKDYGLGKLAGVAGNIPGVSAVGDKLGTVARGVENAVPGLGTIADTAGDVQSWLGSKLPSVNLPKISGGDGQGGLSWGDILKAGGGLATGIADYASSEAARKQQADQFAKTYGLQANQQMLGIQNQLNRAPLADKGQYLALNAAAPTAFQPRDYTQGLDKLQGQSSGGPAAQLAANQITASNYKPGAGNVDTSTLKLLMQRLQGGG